MTRSICCLITFHGFLPLNLTIDQGNTATKLALWDGGTIVRSTICMHLSARDVTALWPDVDIDTAIYCTVSRRPPALMRALERRARHVIEFSADTPMPLTVDYRTPSTLGLDRLAAAVGAHNIFPDSELLVVDLGTAITYDRVTSDARYLGGNIAPGIFMRLKALNHYTARLPLVDPAGAPVPVWGCDTVSALRAGAVRGVVAELEYYHDRAGIDSRVVITGGGAEPIRQLLSFDITIEPNLVPLGLNRIISYNQSINEPQS